MAHKIETLTDRIKALSPHWRLETPAGPGPFGLVIQMHGCGGNGPFQLGYAQAAVKAGCAALILDSYPHRAITEKQAFGLVCTGLKLWGRERAGDLYAAFAWALGEPRIDPKRIFAAGWSHGGWSVLDALAVARPKERARWTGLTDLPDNPLAEMAGAFVVYPYFGMASVARGRGIASSAPITAIVCTKDTVVGAASLARALEAAPKPGAPVSITLFEGATHSFDEPEAKDPRFRFDDALTARSHGLYAAFLSA